MGNNDQLPERLGMPQEHLRVRSARQGPSRPLEVGAEAWFKETRGSCIAADDGLEVLKGCRLQYRYLQLEHVHDFSDVQC